MAPRKKSPVIAIALNFLICGAIQGGTGSIMNPVQSQSGNDNAAK
jgi:hypothetical protein